MLIFRICKNELAARQICPKSSLDKNFRRARMSFEALPWNRLASAAT
jgi:hypothetical protein